MTIKLYGIPQSRSARCLWILEELGLPYENIPVDFIGEAQKPEYLKINPNGRIPALDDDGVVLFESLAINLHLARKYGAATHLWPSSPDDQSRAIQWSIWAMTEVEPPIVKTLMNRLFLPEPQRVEAEAVEGERALRKALAVLDFSLRGRTWLLGDSFSVADLNLFAVAGSDHPALRTPYLDRLDPRDAARIASPNLEGLSDLAEWTQRCAARPALARVLAMR